MNLRKNNNVTENVKGRHDCAGHCIPYNKVLKHVVLLPCNGACSINQIKKNTTHTHTPHTHTTHTHTHTHQNKNITAYLNNKPLEQVTQIKYLEIILDHKFRFNEHITYAAEKSAKLIHSL